MKNHLFDRLNRSWITDGKTGVRDMYRRVGKRIGDVAAALVAGVLLWPLVAVLAVAVRLDSAGPAFFGQERIGRDGRVFRMWKLRTMQVGSERTGSGVYSDARDERVTRVGRFLRRTSLDELPQLWNILRGEMSFVGPRPPLLYHPFPLEEYTEEARRMFDVRPGLTGWAQINGRRIVPWPERIRMNVWYVEHVSFGLDMRILRATVGRVLAQKDTENIGRTIGETVAGHLSEGTDKPRTAVIADLSDGKETACR